MVKDNNVSKVTQRFSIEGMSCAGCSSSIERALNKLDSVIKAEVFLLNKSAVVEFDKNKCSNDEIIQTIQKCGYKAQIAANMNIFSTLNNGAPSLLKPNLQNKPIFIAPINNQKIQKVAEVKIEKSKITQFFDYFENKFLNSKKRLIFSIILSIAIVSITMLKDFIALPSLFDDFRFNAILQLIITLIVMHFGRAFYFRGLKSLFHLNPNMDSLVSIGSLAGFIYSLYFLILGFPQNESNYFHNLYFEGVCVILTFIMLGKYIEEKAKNIATKNAKELLSKKDNVAYKILNYGSNEELNIKEINPDLIRIGDFLQVLPHSFIPVDGKLCSKTASIDESMLSGESIPVYKEKDSNLFAGTMNLENSIIFRATSSTKDSTLSKINALMQSCFESKAKIAQLADRVSGFFVPIVIVLASLSAVFWAIYADIQTAMLYFASTLLISCPCALGLATPMAILFANARANKRGIFFKNAKSLENIESCKHIIFDKTGTLTQGDFDIKNVEVKDNIDKDKLLRICYSIESTSNHVIAKSICKQCANLEKYKIIESKSIINQGVMATLEIDGSFETFILGNAKMLKEYGINNIEFNSSNSGLQVYIGKQETLESNKIFKLIGRIVLSEKLKDNAKETINELEKMGFKCEILSGDIKDNVEIVANELGTKYHSDMSAQEKMQYISKLQSKGNKVIMVGDGANDAIAIAKSDVSLVMASGSEISLENGDIIYFNKNLLGILETLKIGRNTISNIKQNLGFAFIYNIICIPIAMGCFSFLGIILNPMMASFAMSLSSISVVLNSSRLYK